MAEKMKSTEFVKRAKQVATDFKTLYVKGCFGAPLTPENKERYIKHNPYNAEAARVKMINAASDDTFGFDCVCLLKGILWGWNGDASHKYGGAGYAVNGVPDINADQMIKECEDVSTAFSDIGSLVPGEALWTTGHIGVYIGDGLAVECTPAWKNGVQITACNCTVKGYTRRNWKKHGKLPYVDYSTETVKAPALKFKCGDLVEFSGGKHYSNSNATIGYTVRGGKAEIINVHDGKHPYCCREVNVYGEFTSGGVYGWVDKDAIKSTVPDERPDWKVGDEVIYTGSIHYSGSTRPNGAPCKGGRAVITAICKTGAHPFHLIRVAGSGATVYGWVDAGTFEKA